MTDRYAVFGNPIDHSKSPYIHTSFARELFMDLTSEAVLVPVNGFRAAVLAFREAGGKGCNVTVPFKLEAHELATRLTPRAELAGAVNTLSFLGEEIIGENTDGAGLVRDITANLGVNLAGKRVLLLGAGGAARGVVGPLLAERPAQLMIANRSQDKATQLAREFAHLGPVSARAFSDLGSEPFDVVINATAASLADESLAIGAEIFGPATLAYDMMYGRDTPFLALARERGARTSDGLGMLVEQAAESFFVWRGVRPATVPVIAALRAAQ